MNTFFARIISLNRLKSLWSPVCTAERELHLISTFLSSVTKFFWGRLPEIMRGVRADTTPELEVGLSYLGCWG